MSGPNFNITTQQAASKNPSIIDIYDESQMPLTLAPDGVMRFTAALSTKYIIHPGVVFPRIEIPPFTSASAPETIEFTTSVQGQPILVSGSSTPHVWGRNISSVIFRNITFQDSTPQTTNMFDLVGGAPVSGFVFINSVLLNFKQLGELVDVALNINNGLFLNFERGLVSNNNTAQFLTNYTAGRLANLTAVTTQSPALCFMGTQSTIGASISNIQLAVNDSAFCIDSASTGTIDIIGNSYDGVSAFFEPNISNAITVFAEAQVTISSFSDSAANPGTHTDVNFASQISSVIKKGQTILIADEAAYDGLQVVTSVADDQLSAEIEVVFSTSGAGTLEQTQVTSTSNRLVRDQTNTISGTTSYNGATKVSQIVDNNNFIIPVAFVANDATGAVAATSKDSTSIGVTVALNGQAASSNVNTEASYTGSVAVTDIPVVDALVIINESTWAGNQEERLTVSSDGFATYNGTFPVSIKMDGNITLEPATATKELSCQFARQDSARRTVTFNNGADVVNETGTPRANGDTLTFHDNAGTLPSELREDIVYFVITAFANSFQLSYTAGGGAIDFSDDGSGTNTYAVAEAHGSPPSEPIASANARTLVPQSLLTIDPGDKTFIVVSNNDDAVDITVSKAYYRVFA